MNSAVRSRPSLIGNAFASWGAFLYVAAIGFFLSPIVVNSLGTTSYGVWSLLVTVVGYLGLLDFGVRGAVGVSDRGHTAASQLRADDVDWDHLFGELGVRWLHTGGIYAALSATSAQTVLAAVQAAHRHGTVVSYDLNYRPSLWRSIGGQARAQEVNDSVARGAQSYEGEFRLRHKEGHYVQVLSRGFPVRREPGGPVTRIVGTHFDLTERRQAEAELESLLSSRPEDIALAEARLAAAEAALAKAQADAELSRVRAPFAGTILRIIARPGDQVGSDGLLEIGDLTRMDVVADVYETDLPRLRVGAPAEIVVPGESRRFAATVREVGWTVRRQTQANTDPVAAVDARTVEVRLALDEAGAEALRRRSNMQVQVAIRP